MGLFSRKPKPAYVPLRQPQRGELRLPDFAILRRDPQLVQAISELAFTNVSEMDEDSWPTMAKLEQDLSSRLSPDYHDTEKAAWVCRIGVRLGYVVGTLENKSGIARSEMSESHYRGALTLMWSQLNSVDDVYMQDFVFCVEAGYYVSRAGEPAIALFS